ncbi:MAG: helix-turn-helix transcriptional regulator [Oscillospiraceae bacterium]|jgi:transcriptional regulator with XRE-family HTH domain|nr:helix-turn-helix transcriptional regulator [Oscillospiraceae bacterium]
MNISQKVQDELKKHNLTQKELSNHLSIATSTINNWIKLNRSIPAEYIIPICEFLNITPYYLLTGKEKEEFENIPEQELLESYRKLSDFEKGEVLGDIKRRVANAEQVKKPNVRRVYQAARTYDHTPIDPYVDADISELYNAPDSSDEY